MGTDKIKIRHLDDELRDRIFGAIQIDVDEEGMYFVLNSYSSNYRLLEDSEGFYIKNIEE